MLLCAVLDMGTLGWTKAPHSHWVELCLHRTLFTLNAFLHANHSPHAMMEQFNHLCAPDSCHFLTPQQVCILPLVFLPNLIVKSDVVQHLVHAPYW